MRTDARVDLSYFSLACSPLLHSSVSTKILYSIYQLENGLRTIGLRVAGLSIW